MLNSFIGGIQAYCLYHWTHLSHFSIVHHQNFRVMNALRIYRRFFGMFSVVGHHKSMRVYSTYTLIHMICFYSACFAINYACNDMWISLQWKLFIKLTSVEVWWHAHAMSCGLVIFSPLSGQEAITNEGVILDRLIWCLDWLWRAEHEQPNPLCGRGGARDER